MRRFGALIAIAGVAIVPAAARGEEERVPLTQNFPVGEQLAIYAITALDVALIVFQKKIVDRGGDPLIGEPPAFDREISDALYRPGKGKWLGRVPDRLGYVYPVTTFGWYGLDAAIQAIRGRSTAAGRQADHEILALLEAYAIAMGLTQIAKLGTRRERPESALRGLDPERDDEAYLSFWSGHAASSFTLAAFLTRDVGDWLADGPLRRRPALGHALPGILFYGVAAWIAFSRIVDQRHYFSDVLVGSAVGAATGNLIYSLHFDGRGRPRRRLAPRVQVVAFPGGLGISGEF